MKLKIKKCCLIITQCKLTVELKAAITEWLKLNAPGWEGFSINSHAKYLGIYLGKRACRMSLVEPIEKYISRCEDISKAASPMLHALLESNEKCVTVFFLCGPAY